MSPSKESMLSLPKIEYDDGPISIQTAIHSSGSVLKKKLLNMTVNVEMMNF